MSMTIASSAFEESGRIPARHTCEGEDLSPPLAWSGAPEGAQSFVLLCDDPDAPAGTWRHWGVYDIPAEMTALPEGFLFDPSGEGAREAINDFRRPGYGGPCPPPGHGTHHYSFRLLALDTKRLAVGKSPRCEDVEAAARAHILAEAETVGTYSR